LLCIPGTSTLEDMEALVTATTQPSYLVTNVAHVEKQNMNKH